MKALVKRILPDTVARFRQRRIYWKQFNSTGEWELQELKSYVRPEGLAIDVGGNIGVYAYHLGRLANGVVSFEPNPDFAKHLERMKIKGHRIERVALSGTEGEADLRIPFVGEGREDQGMGSLEAEAVPDSTLSRTIRTPLRRLDSYGFDNVGFVKIDVEGHEEEVLRGGLETLKRNQCPVLIEIEERHNVGGLDRINAMLTGLGYQGFFFDKGKRRPMNEFDAAIHQKLTPDITAADHTRRELYYINNFLFLPAAANTQGA